MSDLVRQHREGIGPHARRQDVRQKRAERATRVVTGDQAITKVSVIGGTPGASGAPTDADYLVGTANASLSAEIVVGTTPGGELGGTWAAPTVDATHSGSAHHAQAHRPSQHTEGTAWRLGYQNARGDGVEMPRGAADPLLRAGGAAAAPAFAAMYSVVQYAFLP